MQIVDYPINIRLATSEDIGGVLKIAHQYPKELGFVRIVSLEDGLQRKSLLVAEYENTLAGFLPPVEELAGRKVHLLGGNPHNQIKYIQECTNFTVVSTDINMHTKAASKGTVFDGESIKWKYNEKTKQYNYQERILLSSQNIEGRLYEIFNRNKDQKNCCN